MEDIVTSIATNIKELLEFSYYLIQADTNSEHIYDLLHGQVAQEVLVKIILSNKWDAN